MSTGETHGDEADVRDDCTAHWRIESLLFSKRVYCFQREFTVFKESLLFSNCFQREFTAIIRSKQRADGPAAVELLLELVLDH
jgi:hypothetical protein